MVGRFSLISTLAKTTSGQPWKYIDKLVRWHETKPKPKKDWLDDIRETVKKGKP